MISDAAFSSLRMAASLALAVPTLAVRVSSPEGGVLVEVSWFGGNVPDGAVHVRPCAFRQSVACARAHRDEGHRVAFCGLAPGVDPRIDVMVGVGDRSLPGDRYRVRVHGGWRHLFAALLPAEACMEALGPHALVHRLGFHEDPATGVTLVHAFTADGTEHRWRQLGQAMLEARAILLAEELVAEVAVASRR